MATFWIQTESVRLAIMSRPRGGEWLSDDFQLLRQEGVDVVVSALTPEENNELLLTEESSECLQNGLQFISFPIEDRSVPVSVQEFSILIHELQKLATAGKAIAIHCRAGIGRSSLIAASLLCQSGLHAESAFRIIEESRGCPVPDTTEQRRWVELYIARESHGENPKQ